MRRFEIGESSDCGKFSGARRKHRTAGKGGNRGKEGLEATAAIVLTSDCESCYVLRCLSQGADSQVHRVRSCSAVIPLGVVRT